MTDENGAMQVDVALVRELAQLLDETRLTEIEVQDGARRVKVVRKAAAVAAAPAAVNFSAPAAVEITSAAADHAPAIRSPMVGTVYLSSEPGSKPFAALGDQVAAGDTLVIIEAMKVMNPITAPSAGRVTRICVDNGQPVEFDQPLIVIE